MGTGSPDFTCETIYGILSITVIGGEVDNLYLVHPSGFAGSRISVNLTETANIGNFNYAVPNFVGDMSKLAAKVDITNRSNVKITPPEDAEVTPVSPQPSSPANTEKTEVTNPPETQPLITPSEDTPQTSADSTPAERTEPSLAIIVILIVVAAIIGTGSFVINKIKLNMLK